MSQSSKFWLGVCFLDEMSSDWQLRIDDLLQVPFAYAIHEVDYNSIEDHCLAHVHLLLVFPNPTPYNHALSVFNSLSSVDSICCYNCQAVTSSSSALRYLSSHTSFFSYGNGFELSTPVPTSN